MEQQKKESNVFIKNLVRNVLPKVIVTCIIGIVLIVFQNSHFLTRIEFMTFDMLCKIRVGHPKEKADILLLEIDDIQIKETGAWPWPRVWHSALLEALRLAKTRCVMFDIVFADPTEHDAELKKAITAYKNAYLAYAFPSTQDGKLVLDERVKVNVTPELATAAKGLGFITNPPDIDGIVRKIILFVERDGQIVPSLALKVAADLLNAPKMKLDKKKKRLFLLDNKDNIVRAIPLVENSKMLIDWTKKWKQSYKHIAYQAAIKALSLSLLPPSQVYCTLKKAIAYGKKPIWHPRSLEDKICIVGVSALGLTDIKPTPIQTRYPMIGVHAEVLNSILANQFVRYDTAIKFPLMFIMMFFSTWCAWAKRHMRALICLEIAGLITLIGGSVYLYVAKGIFIHPGIAVLGNIVAYLIHSAWRSFTIIHENISLLYRASRDGLTGLYNRGFLDEVIKQQYKILHSSKRHLFCVVMSDIDFFKKFNDTYGHDAGDAVLKHVSGLIKQCLRPQDIPARYGGEEITAIIKDGALTEATIVARRIRETVENTNLYYKGQSLKITLSIGVAPALEEDTTSEEAINRADQALYLAKKSGRNKVAVFSTDSKKPELAV